MIPRTGNTDPNGTLNGRRASGRLRRRTSTAVQTTTKANSVPIDVISPTVWIWVSPATMATTTPVMIVVM